MRWFDPLGRIVGDLVSTTFSTNSSTPAVPPAAPISAPTLAPPAAPISGPPSAPTSTPPSASPPALPPAPPSANPSSNPAHGKRKRAESISKPEANGSAPEGAAASRMGFEAPHASVKPSDATESESKPSRLFCGEDGEEPGSRADVLSGSQLQRRNDRPPFRGDSSKAEAACDESVFRGLDTAEGPPTKKIRSDTILTTGINELNLQSVGQKSDDHLASLLATDPPWPTAKYETDRRYSQKQKNKNKHAGLLDTDHAKAGHHQRTKAYILPELAKPDRVGFDGHAEPPCDNPALKPLYEKYVLSSPGRQYSWKAGEKKLIMACDGSLKHDMKEDNTGCGVAWQDEKGLWTGCSIIHKVETNNYAEAYGALELMKLAPKILEERGCRNLLVLMDSKDVLEQILRRLEGKRSTMEPREVIRQIADENRKLEAKRVTVVYGKVPGSSYNLSDANAVADELANYAVMQSYAHPDGTTLVYPNLKRLQTLAATATCRLVRRLKASRPKSASMPRPDSRIGSTDEISPMQKDSSHGADADNELLGIHYGASRTIQRQDFGGGSKEAYLKAAQSRQAHGSEAALPGADIKTDNERNGFASQSESKTSPRATFLAAPKTYVGEPIHWPKMPEFGGAIKGSYFQAPPFRRPASPGVARVGAELNLEPYKTGLTQALAKKTSMGQLGSADGDVVDEAVDDDC